jgi:hypothetical protein
MDSLQARTRGPTREALDKASLEENMLVLAK